MKLLPPIRNFKWKGSVSQLFGVNPDTYADFGIPGHNGQDVITLDGDYGYGAEVLAMHDWDSITIETDFPAKKRGNGIYLRKKIEPTQVSGGVAHYIETSYWHLADFVINSTRTSGTAGEVIGLAGNTGYVFPKPSQACPKCGTHLHIGLRYRDIYGSIIENDYHGYCDPTPFLYKEGDRLPLFFSNNLTIGSRGNQVSWLQTVLKIEGLAKDYEPIGYLGNRTFRDVRILQSKYGLLPTGIVTQGLRDILNAKYA